MTALLKPTTAAHTHDRLRAKRIIIDNFTAPEQITVDPEWAAVDADGNFIYDPVRGHKGYDADPINFTLPDVGEEQVTVSDPVTGQTVVISGYGIADAIQQIVLDRLLQAQPDTVQEQIEVVE